MAMTQYLFWLLYIEIGILVPMSPVLDGSCYNLKSLIYISLPPDLSILCSLDICEKYEHFIRGTYLVQTTAFMKTRANYGKKVI